MNLKDKWVDYEDKLSLLEDKIVKRLNRIIFLALLSGFLLIIYQIGFPKENYIVSWVNGVLRQIPRVLMILFLVKWFFKLVASRFKVIFQRKHITDFIIFSSLFLFNFLKGLNDIFSSEYFLYILITTFFLLRLMVVSAEVKKDRKSVV